MNFIRFTPLLISVVCLGCGSSDDGREALSGTVNFQGKPLAQGSIEFAAKDGSSQTGATIADGKFSVPASKGLAPGSYTVRIYASSETESEPGPPGPESMRQVAKELIPAEFNSNSTLTREVKKEGDNEFDFEIP
jgi:hypothetical protein